ncbi:hypothetical protein AGMMS49525_17120 [Bacteroidia bacterium]|nr:hypothetical protein AGMMS49525_17120 [Bacteroidia bacterium]
MKGHNRISPRWGLVLAGHSFRRALPCAIDLWAFSPNGAENINYKQMKEKRDLYATVAEVNYLTNDTVNTRQVFSCSG